MADLTRAVAQDGTDESSHNPPDWSDTTEVSAGGYTPDYRWHALYRFTNVTIPKGATINSAVIRQYGGATWASAPYDTILRGEAVDNSGVLSGTHRFTVNWGGSTTAATTWRIPALTSNVVCDSASIAAIIAEITSRAGWASGNALTLVFDATNFPTTGTSNYMPFRSLEYSAGAYAPALVVTYTGGSSIPIMLSQYSRRW